MMKKQFFLLSSIFIVFLSGCSLQVPEEDIAGAELSFEQLYNSLEAGEEASKKDADDVVLKEDSIDTLSDSSDAASTAVQGGILSEPSDINLRDTDGNGKNYLFTYDGEDFSAVYTTDNWKIYDSYKINNTEDMTIICEALISVHQIHGSDMESYRTAEDMAYEWLQHNIAYQFLSDDSSWKVHAQNVDLDPKDQGKSFSEIYEDRTGKEFNIKDFLKSP
ncbi:hypothetical protein [Butyrivibrio sp. Su6]|uniref:hypothetical protein n=1 Tax=Butyrivibrio sp. Su6 TaxID=1520810 RepID=UPI0011B0862B|nr:hypothetical protein [Butyrivibrio sp. Su6]